MKDKIEPGKYKQLTYELHSLVLSLENQQIDIEAENEWYNISSDAEDTEKIYFPDSVQAQFEKFKKNEVKLYKICNFRKPASSIRYNQKHQYSTEKMTLEDVRDWYTFLKNRLKEKNDEKEKQKKLGLEIDFDEKQMKELGEQMLNIDDVLANFDKYEVVQSSYFKGYLYTMMNYQYWQGNVKKIQYDAISKTKTKISFR